MNISDIENKIFSNKLLTKSEIIFLLNLLNTSEKHKIYSIADKIREQYMGNQVFIRSIIEFSNFCKKNCDYCGINLSNKNVKRYRMNITEILEVCKKIEQNNHTTVVLQSGEDKKNTCEYITEIIKTIKKKCNLAITLSIGEYDFDTYKEWRKAGADRYLLRFETSDPELYKKIHPDSQFENRIQCIKNLKKIGFQTGSGFMIGLPYSSLENIADDILMCYNLDLDMIGIGPFIPHPDTELGKQKIKYDIDFYTGVISVLRIVCKDAHIPATTAFDVLDKQGRNLLLQRGANVFMPNSTPQKYRKQYLLYPDKPCVDENADDCSRCVEYRIKSIGRKMGKTYGHSIHKSIYE